VRRERPGGTAVGHAAAAIGGGDHRTRNRLLSGGVTAVSACGVPAGIQSYGTGWPRYS
jgi:hypothetical protein